MPSATLNLNVPGRTLHSELRAPVKFFSFFTVALLFILHHQLIHFFIRNKTRRLRYFVRSIQLTSKLGAWLLGIDVTSTSTDVSSGGQLFISNHLSYLDVLILCSKYPSLFVTSQEVKEIFFLGKLAELGGCFFVERRKAKRTEVSKLLEIAAMKEKLRQGFDVFLFPEGTSSDGSTVLPFKATFFQLAVDLELTIRPLVLKYKNESQQHAPWYGKMTFASHLYDVCRQQKIEVTLAELPPFSVSCEASRFELAEVLGARIKEAYEQH